MNKYVHKLLSPIFKAAAFPGLSMPHHGYTPDLLLAGVKPLGTLEADEEHRQNELDDAVEEGRLISSTVVFPVTKRFYLYIRPASDGQKIEQGCISYVSEQGNAPFMGITASGEVLGLKHLGKSQVNIDYHQIISAFKARLIDAIAVDEQMIKYNYLPTHVVQALSEMKVSESVVVKECNFSYQGAGLKIYGQKGQEENISLMGNQIKKYHQGAMEDRLLKGTLFGYTKNDIHYNEKAMNPLTRKIMQKSQNFRRWCRAQTMLANAK